MEGLLAGLEQRLTSTDLFGCSDDELGCLVRELNRGRRKLDGYLARIATIARSREHRGDGPSVDQLFRDDGQVSRSEAERQASRGKVADDFPRSAERMHNGEALTENMDTIARLTAKLSDAERQRLSVLDEEIADRAMALVPESFARWLTKLIRSVRDEDRPSTAEEQKAASKLNMGRRRDGMWWLSGVLDPERGAELNAAIKAQPAKMAGDRATTANTRAAALHHLATNSGTGGPAKLGIGFIIDPQTFRHPHPGHGHPGRDKPHNGNDPHGHDDSGHDPHGHDHSGHGPHGHDHSGHDPHGCDHSGHDKPGNGNVRPGHDGPGSHRHGSQDDQKHHHDHGGTDTGDRCGDVVVAQTWAGEDYDPDAIRRLACDDDWYAILINQLGRPDAVGRTRRAATLEQRLALRALYRGCPIDGTPFDYCDIHHVNVAFEDGGQTVLDNLVPISKAWHHRIHDRGWRLTMHPDRTLDLHRPNGQLDRTIPAPKPLTRQRE